MNKENKQTKKKQLEGIVLSNKMQGTVKVRVEKPVKHPQYSKTVTYRKTYFASYKEQLEIGDRVVIEETRPVAKNVSWKVLEVLGK